MREFSKISPSLWHSKRFQNLQSDDAKLSYLYLLTCEHQNSAGAYRLPAGYACHDLGWDAGRYQKTTEELQESDLVIFDHDTDEIMIRRWFKHNPPMNKNHRKGIVSALERLDSELLYETGFSELEAVSPEESNVIQHPNNAGGAAGSRLARRQ
ncbi:MAG: hypothetical protein GY761_16270 [Hyphomicrobiales bacterium]|nr:hypothetical protein [Hyphomicrobiales bacterium]